MANYITLTANTRWIKPIGNLALAVDDGVVAAELLSAAEEAKEYTDSLVGWMYDSTDWETTTPAIIGLANEYLASAIAIDYYMSRDTDVTVGEEYMPDTLWERGMDILNKIATGEMEIVDSSGTLINKIRRNAIQGPVTLASRARFFPDRQTDRSFGQTPPTSAEKVYGEVSSG
jgi:hypothetical protein